MQPLYDFNRGSFITHLIPVMVFVLAMTGSFVFVEPAPVDVLSLGVASLLFLVGLRLPRTFLPPAFFLALFLLGNFLAIPGAADTQDVLIYTAVTTYLVIGICLYAALMYWDYHRLMKYFWAGYVVSALIAGMAAVAGFFELIPGHELFVTYGRASGTFKDPNVYGPYLIAAILYLINSLEDQTPARKFAFAGVTLFLLLALFLSFSRGAIGNFLLCLVIMLMIKISLKNSMRTLNRYILGGAVISVLVLSALVVGIMTSERLQNMVEVRGKIVQEYDVQDGGRFNTQEAAIRYAMSNPVGAGPGDSGLVLGGLEPHNVYLLVLVECGVLGFVGWVGFFGLTLWRGAAFLRQSVFIPKDFLPVYATFIGIVVESFIIDSIHWRHFFVLSGVLWGIMLASRVYQEKWLSSHEPSELLVAGAR